MRTRPTTLIAAAMLAASTVTSHARSLSLICEGTISHYPLMSYTAITGKDNTDKCIFVTNSREGRKILRACPKGSGCRVDASVNMSTEYEIYEVKSARRIDTPAQEARALNEQRVEDEWRLDAIEPYVDRLLACIRRADARGWKKDGDDVKTRLDRIIDGSCAREDEVLHGEFTKQYGPGGHYVYMGFRDKELPAMLEDGINMHAFREKIGETFKHIFGGR
jgi:hypothetical protein